MPHPNRDQVRIPRRLWNDMLTALDQALGQLQAIDTDPGIVTRQVHAFGARVLREARERAERSE
jgi:hypothetical protein